jgi:hypothetical protein
LRYSYIGPASWETRRVWTDECCAVCMKAGLWPV